MIGDLLLGISVTLHRLNYSSISRLFALKHLCNNNLCQGGPVYEAWLVFTNKK